MKAIKKIPLGIRIYIAFFLFVIVLNLLFWNSTFLSDFYVAHVFPIWVATYGRVTGLFSISVGEWMILAGVMLVLFCVAAVLLWIVCKKDRIRLYAKRYLYTFAWIFAGVALVMTLNCFSLYHVSPLEHFVELAGGEALTEDTLVAVWNDVAIHCNELATVMNRNEEGRIVMTEEYPRMEQIAVREMSSLGQQYSRLGGYYPHPKRLFFSDFMCQQHMAGYYFPFSLEANINDVMYITNKPSCMCHELAHLKGYIQENEASFLSFLACVKSEEELFQYSGYLSVLNYLAREVNKMAAEDPGMAERHTFVQVSPLVKYDNVFVLEEDWKRIEKEAIVSTETVDKVSDAFIDTSLKLNGVGEGSHVYGRVVELLMKYYAKYKKF